MTGVAWRDNVPGPCPRCTGYGDAHYLTCPTLRLPVPRWRVVVPAVVTIDGESIAEGYGRVGTNEAVTMPP